jgi:hypothetical protein
MEMSVDSKSLSESVDDLMPNTVDEASRRRSNPQDEMQRILAYNAQVLGAQACHLARLRATWKEPRVLVSFPAMAWVRRTQGGCGRALQMCFHGVAAPRRPSAAPWRLYPVPC